LESVAYGENMKLNLVNQLLAGKILISQSLGVKDGKFRLTACALETICFFRCVAQGPMSHWAVEITGPNGRV
jgi:hypothetical protein